MVQWKCSDCGYIFSSDNVPDKCPSCQRKCTFVDVTCYIPECGGEGNIDTRLLGTKNKPKDE